MSAYTDDPPRGNCEFNASDQYVAAQSIMFNGKKLLIRYCGYFDLVSNNR